MREMEGGRERDGRREKEGGMGQKAERRHFNFAHVLFKLMVNAS